MRKPTCSSWRRRGAVVLALLALLALSIWAPVPEPWQLTLRTVLGVVMYIVLYAQVWHDAITSYRPEDRQASRLLPPAQGRTRSIPMTAVQRNYLARMAARQGRLE